MSLATPTTTQVAANIVAQLETSLGETMPLLPKAFARVLAKALAGVFILLYKYGGFIALQQFVATASWRETTINGQAIRPLVEWGKLIGVGEPEPATRAELSVEITVDALSGTPLPAGAQLLFPDTGVIYLTLAAVPLDAATKTVTVRASSDQEGNGGEGTIGNLEAGDVLRFANPLPNVQREVEVLSQVVTAADGETEEAYRTRVIRRFQRRPQGGAYADYQAWGEEEVGIINVYPYTGDPGEVDVYVEATVASSGSDDGIPTAAQLTAVADQIDLDVDGLPSRRPANAAVNVLPITRTAFDIEVSGLTADDVAAAETAITDAVDEYLRAREPFIVGLSVLPRRDRITQPAVAGVVDEAASALGASITTVELSQGGAVIPAYSLGHGEKAKLGTPAFV